MTGKDVTTNGSAEVADFVERLRGLPAPATTGGLGRLIFALDATASREGTWDLACHVQDEMFLEAARLGGLEVQLVFYRGFGECRSSTWVRDGRELVRLMRSVRCVAGKTQIARVLRHAATEARRKPVQALVFVGDCMEENVDELGRLAGELGLLGTRAFLFHEGHDPAAGRAFRHLAELTRGACLPFSPASAADLRALLGGVAAYAAGGRRALAALASRSGGAVRLLEHQLR
jgi:hypothetical protein